MSFEGTFFQPVWNKTRFWQQLQLYITLDYSRSSSKQVKTLFCCSLDTKSIKSLLHADYTTLKSNAQ